MKSSLAALQPWISGAVMTADAEFDGVCTDSRDVGIGNLFVALKGERFDAHAFLPGVAAAGVAAIVAEHLSQGVTVPALLVPDTRVALREMARHWRSRFEIPVIGVTGSNGKTTVKEMIAAILHAAFGAEQALATRGNLNNEIGVPLTLFRLHQDCRAAVIEMGMNHPGEIALLADAARPTVGLVNNAQREHQEFMASVEAVARENGAVIQGLGAGGCAVYPADDEFTPLWRGYAEAAGCRSLTFGLSAQADVHATYATEGFGSRLQVRARTPGQEQSQGREQEQAFALTLSAAGKHNVRNALAAIACALAAGIGQDAIVRGLEAFAPVSGRLQRKAAQSGALVIDDTYNANPDSVRAAIDVLAQVGGPRQLVLGDMGEVGDAGPQFHHEIGAYAKQKGIEQLLTLGTLARHAGDAFGAGARHFDEINAMCQAAREFAAAGTTTLVKGSRFMKMERVVRHLVDGATPEHLQEVH